MQYVRSFGGSVSKTWNSINPATLSGAIDVIVVEQEDGSLACSPFHVRFGKFSLLRPYEKKVEFKVNGTKQNYAMKLGEGGEAFFVFETSDEIPEGLQTSPVISPTSSPQSLSHEQTAPSSNLQEPEFLDLNTSVDSRSRRVSAGALPQRPMLSEMLRAQSDCGASGSSAIALVNGSETPPDPAWSSSVESEIAGMKRSASEEIIPVTVQDERTLHPSGMPSQELGLHEMSSNPDGLADPRPSKRSISPPPVSATEALNRAKLLSLKLSGSNIPTQVTDSGDLMLDMTGYKSSEEEALRAEVIARKILAEELEGSYDIGALIGADEHGNLWIYSSEEAKEAAARKIGIQDLITGPSMNDAASDPGYQSDDEAGLPSLQADIHHQRSQSAVNAVGLGTPRRTPQSETLSAGELNRNYAKTLRLTSDQLKELQLKSGANTMSFTVNRATCQAYMYFWRYDVPIVISDIDGTITKSDALGHVLNMIGRDWTHIGVAKLYSDIVANGYNIFYLTSRSVGQADTTRSYLNGVFQEGYRLPKGPVILSPDRTVAALRREIYLRKPEVFKMACLRDILNLFSQKRNPFYAGFGNRLTDALSYRSVNIPSTRIFTINSNAEVSLDLLTLHTYKSSYVTMREVVDHFFPPVGLLVAGGGEEFTDFNYWRDPPPEIENSSESDIDDFGGKSSKQSLRSEDEGSDGIDDEDGEDELAGSYLSQDSNAEGNDLVGSTLESIEDDDHIQASSTSATDGVFGFAIDAKFHTSKSKESEDIKADLAKSAGLGAADIHVLDSNNLE